MTFVNLIKIKAKPSNTAAVTAREERYSSDLTNVRPVYILPSEIAIVVIF